MPQRDPVSKSVRFEVFKRDSFTCQYCGRKAPEVVLECDHIDPVANGGSSAVMNLITACFDCNRGKGPRLLDETHILAKQRKQIDELNERRVQLEMLSEWHRQSLSEADHVVETLAQCWSDTHGANYSLNEHGKSLIRKWLKRFTAEQIMTAMAASWVSYAERDAAGAPIEESIEKAFDFVPRVAAVRLSEADKPYLKRLYYIRGILRNRLRYLKDQDALELMEEAVAFDIDLDWLERYAKRVPSWSAFRRSLEDFIQEQRGQ